MLDKVTTAFLSVLSKIVADGSYKVITSSELVAMLPENVKFEVENVKHTIDFLQKHEYIALKFEENQTYCYTLLPKARILLEQETLTKKDKKHKTKNTLGWCLICFFATAAATFLACLVFYFTFLR